MRTKIAKMDYYDLLKYYGIPNRIRHDLRKLQDSLPIITEDSPLFGKSIYYHGVQGSGKTVQAAHILSEYLKEPAVGPLCHPEYYLKALDFQSPDYDQYNEGPQKSSLFCNIPKLLRQIKETFQKDFQGPSEFQLIDSCINADLLVLDDLGVELTTDWSYTILYQIIGERYDEMRPIIFTSNFSLPELADKFQDGRLVSRIAGMCKGRIFEIVGEDKRIK